jgi:hypothetical protein
MIFDRGGLMIHRFVFAVALLACALPLRASAAETAAERRACANDAQTHCPDQIPDRDKVYACLIQKVNLLSPACKKVINDAIKTNRKP